MFLPPLAPDMVITVWGEMARRLRLFILTKSRLDMNGSPENI